jgi:hypothetical protein
MQLASLLVLALAAQSPAVEVQTLKGERLSGELVELTDSAAVLKRDGTAQSVDLSGVLEVQFTAPAGSESPAGPRVTLSDGSRLTCSEISVNGRQVMLNSPVLGAFQLPRDRVAHIRFGQSSAKLDEAWNALLQRESKSDLLVVRKDDVLDFLTGVAGTVADKVQFLIDGDEIPVPRERVYGIIYYRRSAAGARKPHCHVRLHGGDELQVSGCTLEGAVVLADFGGGVKVRIPPASIAALDFSAGKLRYLSQLEPREIKYTPFFDIFPYEYRRDRSLDGPPLSVGGKTYSRGIAMHSRTLLRYRIGGEFSRFQAVMGIDDSVGRLHLGNVHVVISGDGRKLHESDVKSYDETGKKQVAPVLLDLDITGVRDLEIFVDFGPDVQDTGDHLDLADAKLSK